MPSVTDDQISRAEERAGLAWPSEFKDLLPLIRKDWEVKGKIYLNRVLGGGRSGALVYAVDISCREFEGQAILKLEHVDASDWSQDREYERHRQAIELSPGYAAAHLPKLVHAYQKDGQIAILSTVAGRGLQYATAWAECSFEQQLAFARRISSELLTQWNADYEIAEGLLQPQDLLESWLGYRLDSEQGRIGDFLTGDCGLKSDELGYSFEGELVPNPLAFARHARALPKKTRLRAVMGQLHGDLHGNNILIASPPTGRPQYYLIDLELYESRGNLFFDHAYLEISHLLSERQHVDASRWKSILDNLSRFHVRTKESGPAGDDLGLLKLLQTIRRGPMSWIDRNEPNRLSYLENQYLLARIAVGLLFAHRRMPQRLRCMAFTYAAANLKDYLQLNGVNWPMNGPAIEFQGEAAADTDRSALAGMAGSKARSSRAPNWWLSAAAALVVLLAAGGLLWFQPWTTPTTQNISGLNAAGVPESPSIAVLPFRNLTQGPQGDMLANGMGAAITANLAQAPRLFVISQQSAAAIGDSLQDEVAAGKALGVRYVLDGSVQQVDNQIRVLAKLIDVESGEVVWSSQYDRAADDIFAVQDEIALQVLVALQVKLTEGFQAALRGETTNNLNAYLLYTSALSAYRTFTSEAMHQVRRQIDEAIKLDPEFRQAYALKAKSHIVDARFGHGNSADESLASAGQILREAALIDDEISDGEKAEILIVDGYIDLLAKQFDDAIEAGRRAAELSPNNADVIARYAAILFFAGEFNQSIQLLNRAIRLSPIYPSWYSLYIARDYAFRGDTAEAIKWGMDGLARAENDLMRAIQSANLAFIYQEAGREQEARAAADQVKKLSPSFRIAAYRNVTPFRNEDDWLRMARAFRAAGIPE